MKAISFYTLILAVIVTIAFFSSSQSDKKTKTENNVPTQVTQKTQKDQLLQVVRSVPIPENANFAGEAFPIEKFDVKERLERELMVNSYWHSSTLLNLKNANRFFPIIEEVLAREGVPDDFKYLAVAESSLRNLTSPAGAKGVWQFMPGTGKEYGLRINSEIDERYHLEKATVAACKYLKKSKEKFGSWSLAATSYNMGGPNLTKHLSEQHANTFFELNLGEETSRYLFRIGAIKYILSNPEKYGFYLEPHELYAPLKDYIILQVDTSVPSWGDFATKNGTDYRTLKLYNPWLRSKSLTNKEGRTYKIKLPKK